MPIELIPEGGLFRIATYMEQVPFVVDRELARNIAYSFQFLAFLRLLCEGTNINLSIKKSVFKVKIIALGSIMEAILHDVLQDKASRGEIVFNRAWKGTSRKIEWPGSADKRFVAAIEELVDERITAHSDLAWLIDLAKSNNVINSSLAEKCHKLRSYRNSVHTKALEAREIDYYTAEKVDEAKGCVSGLLAIFAPNHDRGILNVIYNPTEE